MVPSHQPAAQLVKLSWRHSRVCVWLVSLGRARNPGWPTTAAVIVITTPPAAAGTEDLLQVLYMHHLIKVCIVLLIQRLQCGSVPHSVGVAESWAVGAGVAFTRGHSESRESSLSRGPCWGTSCIFILFQVNTPAGTVLPELSLQGAQEPAAVGTPTPAFRVVGSFWKCRAPGLHPTQLQYARATHLSTRKADKAGRGSGAAPAGVPATR